MDDSELAFNAWILIGNVLNTLLRGANPVAAGPGRERLQRLDTLLVPVQPPQMLDALRSLGTQDRSLLLEACIAAQIAAGEEAETTLGLAQQDIAPVLALLQTS